MLAPLDKVMLELSACAVLDAIASAII